MFSWKKSWNRVYCLLSNYFYLFLKILLCFAGPSISPYYYYFGAAYTNNEIKTIKNHETYNNTWFFCCRWVVTLIRIDDLLSAPQILFQIYFACWLYLIPEFGVFHCYRTKYSLSIRSFFACIAGPISSLP